MREPTKETILKMLKADPGGWVSSRTLSRALQVSRTAVWKWVNALRQEGYVIESMTNRGYRLNDSPRALTPAEIRIGLKTDIFGRRDIVYSTEIDSTNTHAKRLAHEGAVHGTLAVTECQTQGRGRRGRHWHSPAGAGLYFTMILRPEVPLTQALILGLLTAVALADALAAVTGLDIQLKWPNDVMLNDRKVAGILTEIAADTERIEYLLVGVGVNVNTGDFPDDIRQTATSLGLEVGRELSRKHLFQEFLSRFETLYGEFCSADPAACLDRYRQRCALLNRRVTVDAIGYRFHGLAKAIDESGYLVVETDSGETTRLSSGDVFAFQH